jgi:hypothetical protein
MVSDSFTEDPIGAEWILDMGSLNSFAWSLYTYIPAIYLAHNAHSTPEQGTIVLIINQDIIRDCQ